MTFEAIPSIFYMHPSPLDLFDVRSDADITAISRVTIPELQEKNLYQCGRLATWRYRTLVIESLS